MKFSQFVRTPHYTQGMYDCCYIIKFFQEEWQRDYFLGGKLYMRPQTAFSCSDVGHGRHDISEGANTVVLHRNDKTFPEVKFVQSDDGEVFVHIIEHTKKPENYRKPLFYSYPNKEQQRKLFCMYALWFNKDTGSVRLFDDSMIRDFGQYGVIITDFSTFLNRAIEAGNADPTVLEMHSGFVDYVPDNDIPNVAHMNPYIKFENDYGGQSEYRICAETNNKELIELGMQTDLRDIVISINMHRFKSSIRYANGTLSFEDDSD